MMSPPDPPGPRRGPLTALALPALLAGATGIGFAGIFFRWSELGPLATGFWRLTLALPVLAALTGVEAAFTRRARPGSRNGCLGPTGQGPPRRHWWWLLLPGALFASDLGLWHWALTFTKVANATLLTNFAPVFVVLGARLLLGERLRPLFLLGLVTALTGAVVLVAGSCVLEPRCLPGDALALASAVFYGSYQLSVRALRRHFSAATIMTAAAGGGAVLLAIGALVSREPFWAATAAGWWLLVRLALISHVGGQGLIVWALGHLPASFSSVSLLWQPVVAAVLAWHYFQERLTALQCAAGAVVLVGIILARQGTNPAPPPAVKPR